MYQYLGLIIGVEKYHDKTVRPVRYAQDDAKEFRQTLIDLGGIDERLKLIPNEEATKAILTQEIKDLCNRATELDTLVFYFAGHGFYYNGENVLACVDSLQRSITETTVNLNQVLSSFEKSKSKKIMFFLDCCHSGIDFSESERSPVSDFSIEDVKFYARVEHLVAFASCKSDEKSQTDIPRKHGAWSYYLLQALQGKAEDSIYDGDMLISGKLQRYLLENTRRRVKEIHSEKAIQTPMIFGKQSADFVVADLGVIFDARKAKIKTAGVKLERAVILASEEDWVRNLPGFNKAKGHTEPKVIDDYHEGWIKKIAAKLIQDELDEVAESLKETLGYSRRELEASDVYDGFGQIGTPDFDYVVRIAQSSEDSKTYVLTRSIEHFTNSDILTKPEFNEVFANTFNEIEFSIKSDLKVVDVIDKIEAIKNRELIRVEYKATDLTRCTIFIKGFSGSIEVSGKKFKITSKTKVSPEQMLLSFKTVYEKITGHEIPKLLL